MKRKKPAKQSVRFPDAFSQNSGRYFPRTWLTPLFIVAAIAFCLRFMHLLELNDTPFFSLLIGDAEIFDIWATEISKGNWIGDRVFFQAPLYPYFLAAIYTVFGRDLFVVRLIQILVGTLSCVLLMETARSFFNRTIGLIAGLLLAVSPAAIYFDVLVQKAAFGLFFMTLLLFLISRIAVRPGSLYGYSAGLVLGLFVLIRENALILLPILLLWLVVHFRKSPKRHVAAWSALLLFGTATVLFPVALRNKWVGDEWVLTTSNFGFNLYVGNSGRSTGTYTSLVWGHGDWRYERRDAADLAEKALGRKLSPSEVSKYWTAKTVEEIRSDPGSWLRLVAKKWLLVWNAVEISDTESVYAHRDYSPLLKGLGAVFHFGVLFPIAIFGILCSWQDRKKLWILYLIGLGYAAGVAAFFVFARFRHPVLPIVVMFAGAAIAWGFEAVRDKKMKKAGLYAGVMLISAVIVNWPFISKDELAAHTYYNWGVSLADQGRMNDAKAAYAKSLGLNPLHVMARNNLGIILNQQGKTDESLDYFRAALKINPNMAETHNNLALAYYQQGKLDQSLEHFQNVLRINPDYGAHVYFNIACIYSRQGKVALAVEWLKQAIDRGYRNLDNIKKDKDLENIRHTDRYKALIEKTGQGRENRHMDSGN